MRDLNQGFIAKIIEKYNDINEKTDFPEALYEASLGDVLRIDNNFYEIVNVALDDNEEIDFVVIAKDNSLVSINPRECLIQDVYISSVNMNLELEGDEEDNE